MTAALIIAAGKTSHKNAFSPGKEIGGVSALRRIALLFHLVGIERIVVVGEETALVQKLAASMNLVFLPASENGEMLDNIKLGLQYLQDKCSATLISYVDVPMFSAETVHALLNGSEEACIPVYNAHPGHPILLRAARFADILLYNGAEGLKGAMAASGIRQQFIATDDPGILAEGTVVESYESLRRGHDIWRMRASVQIKISKEKSFYSPEVHHLLQLTDEFGSLANACLHMGMSYSKGRKIIFTMEEQLGAPVLETRQGGKSGGYSRLTAAAREMMQRYSAFQSEAETVLQELFHRHFPPED